EAGVAAVKTRQAGDELLDDDRLAHPGAAEEAGLAAADERAEEVDDLDPGLEQLGLRGQLVELGRLVVDGAALRGLDRPQAVDGGAHEVEADATRPLTVRP